LLANPANNIHAQCLQDSPASWLLQFPCEMVQAAPLTLALSPRDEGTDRIAA